ncbi:hypothetical protein D3C73_1414610 [compost metagenome]
MVIPGRKTTGEFFVLFFGQLQQRLFSGEVLVNQVFLGEGDVLCQLKHDSQQFGLALALEFTQLGLCEYASHQ